MATKDILPYRMKKGETLNPNGRPRKYVTLLKEIGYKQSEINDTLQAMMAMDLEELKAVWDNPKATILEKTVANAMRKSLEKGSLYSLETLLTRVYGKPRETIDTNNKTEFTGKIQIELKGAEIPLSRREADVSSN
jgi:ABC-type Fe3+-citrate transport system substrate-binding protein